MLTKWQSWEENASNSWMWSLCMNTFVRSGNGFSQPKWMRIRIHNTATATFLIRDGLQFTTMCTEVNLWQDSHIWCSGVGSASSRPWVPLPRLLAVSTTTCASLQEYTIQRQVFVRRELHVLFCSFKTRVQDVYLGSPIMIFIHPRSWIQQQQQKRRLRIIILFT